MKNEQQMEEQHFKNRDDTGDSWNKRGVVNLEYIQ